MRATTSASSDINEGCPGDTAKMAQGEVIEERRFSEVKMHNNNSYLQILTNQGTVPFFKVNTAREALLCDFIKES
jgi:hypothetical protein